MHELLILNKIIAEKNKEILKQLKAEWFLTYKQEFEYILKYFKDYNEIPSEFIVAETFPQFEFLEVTDSYEFLVYKLKENVLYLEVQNLIQGAVQQAKENDAYKGLALIEDKLQEIKKHQELFSANTKVYDIMQNAEDRLKEYEKRCQTKGLIGISSGINMLDEYLHGWVAGEELVTIVGRTNEGKSWILLYFLVQAFLQGKKVLLYSGEMGYEIVGFRVDTFIEHFSNKSLMHGNDAEFNDYKQYIERIKQKQGFYVVTPKEFGGNKPTVNDIKRIAEQLKVDIVGIDQLTLMNDQRKGENTRIRYTNISEDLFNMSADLKLPVLCVTQANRDSVKDKKRADQAPELVDVAESDGIVQNSSRVLTIKVIDEILKLNIKKNRYGINNKEILLKWDIDRGIIKPLVDTTNKVQLQQDYGF